MTSETISLDLVEESKRKVGSVSNQKRRSIFLNLIRSLDIFRRDISTMVCLDCFNRFSEESEKFDGNSSLLHSKHSESTISEILREILFSTQITSQILQRVDSDEGIMEERG